MSTDDQSTDVSEVVFTATLETTISDQSVQPDSDITQPTPIDLHLENPVSTPSFICNDVSIPNVNPIPEPCTYNNTPDCNQPMACNSNHTVETVTAEVANSESQLSDSNPERQENVIKAKQQANSRHLRKRSRPQKLNVHRESEGFVSNEECPGESVLLSSEELAESVVDENFVRENSRRKSLRPRRIIKPKDSFQNEEELDQLLNDENTLQAYGPAQHWNTGSDYITISGQPSVERIIAHRVLAQRKLTKFIMDAQKSYPRLQQKMVALEYFVKFHDQSYWHCAWVPGAFLLAMHPSLVRNYLRNVQLDDIPELDQILPESDIKPPADPSANHESVGPASLEGSNLPPETEISQSAPFENEPSSQPVNCGIKSFTVSHSSEESSDNEDVLNNWSADNKENVSKWISSKPGNFGSRRRYLLKWGVQAHLLIPERILALGGEINVSQTDSTSDDASNDSLLESSNCAEYHEVLVKWLHVPHSQATWETVEKDSDMLDDVSFHANTNQCVLKDEAGRRLLPKVVRRHLIQLADAYSSRIAQMLCDAYGSHDTIGKRPPANFGDWKNKWVDTQPDYLSPEHHIKLYPYQLDGVRWLWHAYHNHVNTILADEMGLGKTVQVIALLYSLWKERNDYGPFLIIAPVSTLLNWEREFRLWAPDFHVLVYSGDKTTRTVMQTYEFRIPNSGGVAAFHVLITSHEMACLERSILRSFDWSALIIDEAHRLKNKQSRLFREASQYRAAFKMLLTGTPLQNNLEELFHLLYFVEPKSIADFKTLTSQWADMPKSQRISSLHKQLRNHLLRRLKVDVIQDLPKKYELTVMVDMSVLQRKLYKLVLTKNYEELRCGSISNSLVHLQKVCDHPYLLPVGDAIAPRIGTDEQEYEPRAFIQVSGKMVVLMDMLRGLRERKHRVLIYSRMTTMLDLLEIALTNVGYEFERIDGRVRGPLRQITVDRFNAPNCEVFIFLLSTRAGGEGINLASADTVILYDSDWNPQCDLQALSRAHRIGQSRPVVVYRFITRHSLEERINFVARRKLALTDLVVNNRQQRKQDKKKHALTTTVSDDTVPSQDDAPEGDGDKTSAVDPAEQQPENPNSASTSSEIKLDTPSQSTTATSVSNRLTRAEMNDMLRSGLDALFSVEDLLDEDDLKKAVCLSGLENEQESNERIVYDSDAIARLLDRSNLTEDSAQELKSAADEYLGSFRVAHFDTAVTDEALPAVPADNELASCKSENVAESVDSQIDATNTGELLPPSDQSLGYAAFWDKLLKERYNRLCELETHDLTGLPRRCSKYNWRTFNNGYSDSDEEPSRTLVTSDSEVAPDSVKDSASRHHSRRRPTASRQNNQPADGFSRTPTSVKRDTHAETARLRGKSGTTKSRRPTSSAASSRSNASLSPSEDDRICVEEINSDEDPSYVPSDCDSDDAFADVMLIRKWRKRDKTVKPELEKQEIPISALMDGDTFGNIDNRSSCTAVWHPSSKVCAKWRESVASIGPKIAWHRGQMFIYGFGPHDRQAFANAVMRYGLPPPGIVPPQEWLPPSLYSKSPQCLFAYTTLFMQHLYDDPDALDDSKTTWCDGLPKERICTASVLSRIAMMSLIRNKVLQFEDINGVHSRTYEALSTRFKFTIHDGALTLLRSVWQDEWRRINEKVHCGLVQQQQAASSVKRDEATRQLQRIWHSRHDYWLLAAIHVHGYLQWNEILGDPRFYLLNTGVEGVLEQLGLKPEKGQTPNFIHTYMAETQGFLHSRLRMLEHALLVEQALFEVAKAALTASSDGKHPVLARVQNLAVCLSNKLASAGPRKRIALPRDKRASEATRAAVHELQDLLEDIYADLPGLPASIVCAETDTNASANSTCSPSEPVPSMEHNGAENAVLVSSSSSTSRESSITATESNTDNPNPEVPDSKDEASSVPKHHSPKSPLGCSVIEISDGES